MIYLECVPAYGRDYKSKAAVMIDWNAGKDWQIVEYGESYGQYINKESIKGKEITLNLRYKSLTMIAVVKG